MDARERAYRRIPRLMRATEFQTPQASAPGHGPADLSPRRAGGMSAVTGIAATNLCKRSKRRSCRGVPGRCRGPSADHRMGSARNGRIESRGPGLVAQPAGMAARREDQRHPAGRCRKLMESAARLASSPRLRDDAVRACFSEVDPRSCLSPAGLTSGPSPAPHPPPQAGRVGKGCVTGSSLVKPRMTVGTNFTPEHAQSLRVMATNRQPGRRP